MIKKIIRGTYFVVFDIPYVVVSFLIGLLISPWIVLKGDKHIFEVHSVLVNAVKEAVVEYLKDIKKIK